MILDIFKCTKRKTWQKQKTFLA